MKQQAKLFSLLGHGAPLLPGGLCSDHPHSTQRDTRFYEATLQHTHTHMLGDKPTSARRTCGYHNTVQLQHPQPSLHQWKIAPQISHIAPLGLGFTRWPDPAAESQQHDETRSWASILKHWLTTRNTHQGMCVRVCACVSEGSSKQQSTGSKLKSTYEIGVFGCGKLSFVHSQLHQMNHNVE